MAPVSSQLCLWLHLLQSECEPGRIRTILGLHVDFDVFFKSAEVLLNHGAP